MTTLKVRIESMADTLSRAAEAFKSAESGLLTERSSDTLAFGSWEAMHRTLAPKRLEIVRCMAGQGAMTVRDVARAVGRDIKNVHADLDLLAKAGVINRVQGGGFEFDYDLIHFEFDIKADNAA